jgi:glycosyltransferase involved in cell wall biosynthesis
MAVSMKVLYLSYTGLLEPLGQSQVLAYLRRLATDHAITVVSFEKPADLANEEAVAACRRDCEAHGIRWWPLTYHTRPRLPATLWDMLRLLLRSLRIRLRGDAEVIHARSYVPAFVALLVKRLTGTPFIFDMRAFWPDEMVSAGRLRADSFLYRLLKRVEHHCLLSADTVVCLTEAAAEHLCAQPEYRDVRFAVIPTCTDLDLFVPRLARPPRDDDRFVLGCIGTVTSGWFLIDWLVGFFLALRAQRPEAVLRLVTRDDPARVYAEAARRGLPREAVEVRARAHREMPGEIWGMDASVMFFTPSFSKLGSSPTRMGEVLGCGIPCVANAGVGDVERIIRRFRVGIVVSEANEAEMEAAARELLSLLADPEISGRCRRAAEEWFSLDRGVAAYRAIYDRLAPDVASEQ